MKTRFRQGNLLLAIFALAAFAPSSYASLIFGTFAVSGTGPTTIGGTGLAPIIDFQLPANPAGNGTGLFDIVSGNNSFVPLVGTQAIIRDLNVGTLGTGPVSYANFVTFAAQPTWSITLTQLLPGVFGSGSCAAAPAAGQTCTPGAASPLNLINFTTTSSQLGFSFIGTAVDSATPGLTSTVTGNFVIPFSDLNTQQILSILAAGGTVTSSDSASITLTSAVPEPGTMGLSLLGGLIMLAVRKYRR